MDLRRDFLFPVIIWIVIQRDFILGGQARFNNESLILESGDMLEINTTVPSIVRRNHNSTNRIFTASLEMKSFSQVAFVTFSGNIELKEGSRIIVTGKYALSIKSENGNISIQTDINMTCNEENLHSTCLGGFTHSQTETEGIYKGLGPGGLKKISVPSTALSKTCLPGSNHGGSVPPPKEDRFQVGDSYDKENLTTFRGGSGGSCRSQRKSVAGGGAIELISKTGSISIDASIIASATRSGTGCSGGSGGLIRLKAWQVEVLGNGRLEVQGGDGNKGTTNGGEGGGAGGIIQIISPVGNLSAGSLSLALGTSSNDVTCKQEQEKNDHHGFYYLQALNITGHNRSFPQTQFPWNVKPHFTHTITPSSTTSKFQSSSASPTTPGANEHDVIKQIDYLANIQSSSEKYGNWTKLLWEVISVHKNLASSNVSQQTVRPLCLESFMKYRGIVDGIARHNSELLKETLQGMLKIASNCIERKNHPVWRKNRMLPELMQSLQDILVTSLQGNGSTEVNHVIVSSNAVAQVVRESSTAQMTDITIPNFSVVEGDSWKNVTDFLVIPRSTVMKAKGNYTYVFVLFKEVANSLPNNTTKKYGSVPSADWEVSSLVMSCFLMLDNVPVKDLSPPARLTFNTSVAQTLDKQCSFWDSNGSYWSAEGLKLISPVYSQSTVCETNHFTSFAVLIKHHSATELSYSDKLALSIITYIGCGVSTVALALTLIVFLSVESLSTDRHKIHMNLALSLLLAQVLFLAGIKETSNQVTCKMIAVFMHYLYLTAFTWMLVEGLHLYLKVVQVFKTENVKMIYYYIFGWGKPLFLASDTITENIV